MEKSQEIIKNSLFAGRLTCFQNRKGYRFSIDSVLLAHFSLHWKKASILDLGCGCGILGLLLLYRNGKNIISVTGIEVQKRLERLALMNSRENNYSDKYNVVFGDFCQIKDFFPPENFSHVICNPPFYQVGRGRKSSNEESFIARHQSMASLPDIINSAAYSLKNGGLLTIIYPAEGLAELINHLEKKNIQPKRLQIVYAYPEKKAANLILLECKKNGGVGMKVLSPLYIYQEQNGPYTREVEMMYDPQ